jgi:ADP-ribose pyrophosphatase YjhB (NUDIX family)
MYASTLGYAQMRPAGVESNHFAYHLDQLVKAGYIGKEDRNYFLTSKGKALTDRTSHEKMDVRIQPQIVTSVFVTNEQGETLMFKHNFQPYLDLYGTPQGRLHFDEKVGEAAKRELKEKTGLEGVELTHRGVVYVHTVDGQETVSKLLTHVFSGTVTGKPELTASPKSGEPVWVESSSLEAGRCMPGFKDIEAMLAKNDSQLFFAEIDSVLTSA